MKRIVLFMMLVSLTLVSCKNDGVNAPKPTWFPKTEKAYDNQVELFNEFPISETDVVFAGGNFIANGNWSEMFSNASVKNRGIAGEGVDGLIYRATSIAQGKPKKLFFQVGYEDLFKVVEPKDVYKKINEFVSIVKNVSPETELYFISVIKYEGSNRYFKAMDELNSLVEAGAKDYTYIDVTADIIDENGVLKHEYFDTDYIINELGYYYILSKITSYAEVSPVKVKDGDKIVMMGGDIMEKIDWAELIPVNGIIDRTRVNANLTSVMGQLSLFIPVAPAKVYMMPSKDEIKSMEVSDLWNGYKAFINDFNKSFPNTQLYILAQLPYGTAYEKYDSSFNNRVVELNKLMDAAQSKYDFLFLDPATVLADESGNLKSEYTYDGENLNVDGIFTFATMLLQGPRMMALNPNL